MNKENTMQFPDEPTFADRAREMTRTYRYRIGPTLLLGAMFAGRGERPWQAVGIVMLGLLVIEGVLKVYVKTRKHP
jgi:hypothetical protein